MKVHTQYGTEFYETFGVQLSSFWDRLTGFKVVEFDSMVIHPLDGESMADAIRGRFGERAAEMIHELIGIMPLIHYMQA